MLTNAITLYTCIHVYNVYNGIPLHHTYMLYITYIVVPSTPYTGIPIHWDTDIINLVIIMTSSTINNSHPNRNLIALMIHLRILFILIIMSILFIFYNRDRVYSDVCHLLGYAEREGLYVSANSDQQQQQQQHC